VPALHVPEQWSRGEILKLLKDFGSTELREISIRRLMVSGVWPIPQVSDSWNIRSCQVAER
jgi:hypothetical protein